MSDAKNTHVALLASPGMGHLIPILELAKRIISRHHFTATVFVVSLDDSSPAYNSILDTSSLPPSHLLQVTSLPTVAFGSSATPVFKLRSMMRSVLPHLRSAISQQPTPPTALFVDPFGTEAFNIADEFGMKKYVFFTSSAWFLALALYVPALDKENIRANEEVRISGCKPIRFEDLPYVVSECDKPDYPECVNVGSEMARADGILVNTWEDLERSTIISLRADEVLSRFIHKTPVHPIGPITKRVLTDGGERNRVSSTLLSWLDEQPCYSVLYVSFGSDGTLSSRQMIELANGLELSQQRFIWVIRPPLEFEGEEVVRLLTGSTDECHEIISRFVPDGFLDRAREMGRTTLMWAPQSEILAHHAVGGFLTHCGWNSTLESISNGVPMIGWPLFADQTMNATFLCEEARVAIRPEALPAARVIGSEEIEKLVRNVIVGNKDGVKERAKELQTSAHEALSEGGSSSSSLAQVAEECELHAVQLR